MAAGDGVSTFSGSGSGGPSLIEEMNGAMQVLAWVLIKRKLYHGKRWTKWHAALYGKVSCMKAGQRVHWLFGCGSHLRVYL